MKTYFAFMLNLIIINFVFPQEPCLLGEVYISESENTEDPEDYIDSYLMVNFNKIY